MERNIKLLTAHSFFIELSFFAPVAILYYSGVAGSFALGMSIFSWVFVSSALFEIPTGMFSDYIGRKNTVTLGALSNVLAVVCYALGGSYAILALGASLEGLGRSFYSGNNNALLHDTLAETKTEHTYHEFLGKITAYEHLGTSLVVLVGGILASMSFSLVVWLTLIPKAINLMLSFFVVEPAHHTRASGNMYLHLKDSLRQFRTSPKLQLLTMAHVIRGGIGEAGYLLRPAFINSVWPLWAIGISSSLSNLGATVGFFYSGKIINKLSPKIILYGELIINRLIALTAYGFPTVASPILIGFTSLFYGPGHVSLNSLMQKEFSDRQRATMGSLNSLATSVAFGIMAIFVGSVADKLGPGKTLVINNVILLSLLFIYPKIFKKPA